MRQYDLITILGEGDKLEETKKAVNDVLERFKVEIVNEEDWGVRKLPHEVDHATSGSFTYRKIRVTPTDVKAVTHDLSLLTGVVRYMVTLVA